MVVSGGSEIPQNRESVDTYGRVHFHVLLRAGPRAFTFSKSVFLCLSLEPLLQMLSSSLNSDH